MTTKRLVALILATLMMAFGILWIARANQFNRALQEADLSQVEETTLPGASVIAYMAVAMTASFAGVVGALFFLVASVLLAALIYKLTGKYRLIPVGLLLIGWIVIFLV